MSMLASSSRCVPRLARTAFAEATRPRMAASTPRAFSTTPVAHKDNIGKVPIPVPPSVSFEQTPTSLAVTGPLGTTHVPLEKYMILSRPTPHELAIRVEDRDVKQQRSMWGLTRTLIANAITGMTEGFSVPLYLVGVGYRAAIEDDPRFPGKQRLSMKLGYSHLVHVTIPDYIKAEVPHATKISLFCTDKHLLGLFAAKVREWRKPEPFKGKGVFVGKETIRIKAVKKK